MPILEARGLVKVYGRRRVVDGVSFAVEPGEVVGLLGPNGAGKTTSFRMTTGQINPPDDGRVIFNGQDVTRLPMYRRARLGMGYLSQESSVFRKLTVEQNILAILEALPVCRSLGRRMRRRERWARADAVLEQFGLTHIRKNLASRVSGGEKRRLEIARCLVCEPLMILLDEPFAAVDPLTKEDIRKIVKEMARAGISVLLTDHDVREVLKITDRSYLIKDGRVRTHGTPRELIHDPVAINEYIGTSFSDNTFGPGVGLAPSLPVAPPPVAAEPELSLPEVVEREKIRRLVEGLIGPDAEARAAYAELVRYGRDAVPALLEALGRRDMELRRRAFAVLQLLAPGEAVFDPFAPDALRRQQLAAMRERLGRAG